MVPCKSTAEEVSFKWTEDFLHRLKTKNFTYVSHAAFLALNHYSAKAFYFLHSLVNMLKFTSIVGYTSCGSTYIESFLTIFGQCINVLNYNKGYQHGVAS